MLLVVAVALLRYEVASRAPSCRMGILQEVEEVEVVVQ